MTIALLIYISVFSNVMGGFIVNRIEDNIKQSEEEQEQASIQTVSIEDNSEYEMY